MIDFERLKKLREFEFYLDKYGFKFKTDHNYYYIEDDGKEWKIDREKILRRYDIWTERC